MPPGDAGDEYANVPVAQDTLAAKWEAMYCLVRADNIRLHEDAARHLQALAVAMRALAYYADRTDGDEAKAAMETIRRLTKGVPDARQ